MGSWSYLYGRYLQTHTAGLLHIKMPKTRENVTVCYNENDENGLELFLLILIELPESLQQVGLYKVLAVGYEKNQYESQWWGILWANDKFMVSMVSPAALFKHWFPCV